MPDEILDRPKQGFRVPLSTWLRGELRTWARDVLLDPETLDRGYFDRGPSPGCSIATPPAPTATQTDLALLMLELWHREFIDPPGAGELRAAA